MELMNCKEKPTSRNEAELKLIKLISTYYRWHDITLRDRELYLKQNGHNSH